MYEFAIEKSTIFENITIESINKKKVNLKKNIINLNKLI